jgi:nucleotide-binding universal stress UspA family protein
VLCESGAAAEMVVIGSWGHGGLQGSLLGSVSQKVAAHTSGRVVVVRGHWRPAAGYIPGPVVVGVDGSAASRAAIEFAGEEAALRAVAVVAVCAPADTPGNLGGARLLREDFGQVVADYEKNHPGLTVLEQIADGSARAALLTAARDAQLLVVGSRGQGGLPGMPLGSVSLAVLHCAACPVSVVHPQ